MLIVGGRLRECYHSVALVLLLFLNHLRHLIRPNLATEMLLGLLEGPTEAELEQLLVGLDLGEHEFRELGLIFPPVRDLLGGTQR